MVKAWRRRSLVVMGGAVWSPRDAIHGPPSPYRGCGREVKAVKAEQAACSRCTLLRCEEEAKIETTSGTASCLGCDSGAFLHVTGIPRPGLPGQHRSEEHTSELQSLRHLV